MVVAVVVVVVVVVEVVVVVVVVVVVELADARSTTITCFVEGGLGQLVNFFFLVFRSFNKSRDLLLIS